ncbi:Na(+)/citrate cotransporter-like [Oratosquilla oratoria]|uniref:Na(+)/citrate cotransporter-like n=1 Tax=Oratosquilla oratoria TaxID=337810 RepID=UPI003F774BF7
MQLSHIKPYWRSIAMIVATLIFAPIAGTGTAEGRCAYVIILMATFWVTDALPIAITALIPVFAFPVLGILSTGDVCHVYMKETNMMFLGGLIVALAVEHCNLHRRIALIVILNVGQSPRRLMAGFMMTTMFLSMWISNTATTAMMTPIVSAILAELYKGRESDGSVEMGTVTDTEKTDKAEQAVDDKRVAPHGQSRLDLVAPEDSVHETPGEVKDVTTNPPDDESRRLRDMCFLGTAYAANLGGTGSLTGTGPNLVLKGVLQNAYEGKTGLNFTTWMGFNVPGMLICVLLAWLWLQFLYIGFGKNSKMETTPDKKKAIKKLIHKQYSSLGPMTFHECVVLMLFIALVLLWLFRSPEFVAGWGSLFDEAFDHKVEVDDASPVMLIVFLLFVIPSKLNFWCFRDSNDMSEPESSPACLTWQVVHEKIPWKLVLLLGGGFAMAKGAEESGLSKWLGQQLVYFDVMPPEAIVFVVCLMTAMVTEVASNSATSAIILPVLKELAVGIDVNPLYLMLPATVCCSYAFMLPVATPPNAIVYGVANMKSSEMLRAGVVMNVLCVIVITVMINTLGVAMFDVKNLPTWANTTVITNATIA